MPPNKKCKPVSVNMYLKWYAAIRCLFTQISATEDTMDHPMVKVTEAWDCRHHHIHITV